MCQHHICLDMSAEQTSHKCALLNAFRPTILYSMVALWEWETPCKNPINWMLNCFVLSHFQREWWQFFFPSHFASIVSWFLSSAIFIFSGMWKLTTTMKMHYVVWYFSIETWVMSFPPPKRELPFDGLWSPWFCNYIFILVPLHYIHMREKD